MLIPKHWDYFGKQLDMDLLKKGEKSKLNNLLLLLSFSDS